MIRQFSAAALMAGLAAPMALAQDQSSAEEGFTLIARAEVMDTDGAEVGTVTINETESGTMLVILALTDVPEGARGVHVHETGDCSADGFSSAGDHLSGDAEHGVFAAGGPHPGDLPNIVAGSDGSVNVEYFNDLLTADILFDDDGSAFILHQDPDDYISQPSGDAGSRLFCGEFEDVREG